jgi:protease II
MAADIRNLGYIVWKDPWAWMESMRGKRWENLIKREKQHYHDLVSQRTVAKIKKEMETELEDVDQYMNMPSITVGCGNINIIMFSGSSCRWKWAWTDKYEYATDMDTIGQYVWYSKNIDNEIYGYEHICKDATGKEIWKKREVSPQIAVIGSYCYYIKMIDYFKTVELRVCNAYTGKGDRILYREKNKEKDIYLYKAANRTLYFISADPQVQTLYRIDGLTLIPLYNDSMMQMPLGLEKGEDCVLVRYSHMEDWTPMGYPISTWNFPKEEIQWASLYSGHVITIKEGSQKLWYCASRKRPVLLCTLKVGSITPNTWSTWENMLKESFVVKCPTTLPYMFHIINHKIEKDTRSPSIEYPLSFKPLEVHKLHTTSFDGTKVPYVIIKEKGVKPKAQFIYVYGAYGTVTPIDWPYESWYPLLSRKWAVVFAMVRGGGDDNEAWEEMARRDNRHVVVDDFEAIIRDSKRKLRLGANKTVIYGRSAGGLPIGAIVSRFPHGELVGAAFTEVPYVDILRTSTNHSLPLTIGEFKEFGNPKERILNFKELLSVSPVNTLHADGAPGVFVLSRVGLLDRQVYAYESLKWIQRLRGAQTPDESNLTYPKGKYIAIERKEGHSYGYQKFIKCRSSDLAIIDAWVDGTLKYELE